MYDYVKLQLIVPIEMKLIEIDEVSIINIQNLSGHQQTKRN